ncbi:MAG: hypothetical protein ACTSYB_13680 [Candidatus Helarchaeota archaeon]
MQKAIYYCLGDPESIQELLINDINSSDSIYNLLNYVQNLIEYWIQKFLNFEIIELPDILADAKIIFNLLKAFIDNFLKINIPLKINSFPGTALL